MTEPKSPVLADSPTSPYSQEAEEAVIGSVLINPPAYISVAAFLEPDDFFLLRHTYIWQAFHRLSDRDEPIDPLTVSEELSNMRLLNDIGGTAYLVNLINKTPTSVYAEVYGRIVERTALRRRMMEAAEKIQQLAIDEERNIETVINEAEAAIFNVSATQRSLREFVPMLEIMSSEYDRMEDLGQSGATPGIPTGFKGIDNILGGLHKGDLIMFGGRPGQGKSGFLTSISLNAARVGARVAIFTMEMGTEQYGMRLAAMESGISVARLRSGQLSDPEKSRYVEAISRLSTLAIFIDDSPAINPMEMRTKCRRMKHEHGLDLILVDYIQLMNAGVDFKNNRVQEVSYISRSLKELAREMNVPLLSAAQLSRAVEQRQNKRPQLSDLRDSGSLEMDSDIVMFIYRDEYYNPDTEFPNQADILIPKHRNGATGSSSLFFQKETTRFMDARTYRVSIPPLKHPTREQKPGERID